MKVDIIDSGTVERIVKVNLDWEEVVDTYKKTFNRLRKELKIDGFRPGKVPEAIAKRLLSTKIKYDFSNDVVETTYRKVLEKNGIDDYVDLTVKDIDFKENESFDYSMSIEVDPEIKIIDYKKGFPVSKITYVVDEKSVDQHLEAVREQYAEVREVTDGAQEGHYILCDLQETEKGVPIVGKKIEDRIIKIGEGISGEPDTNKLIGAKSGDKILFSIKQEDGTETTYEINVKRVESRIFPELTDDFVKENFEKFDSYEEFRKQIEKSLQEDWDKRSEKEYMRAISDYFVNKIDFELPPSRISRFLDSIVETKRKNSQTEIDDSKFREQYKSTAIWEIKWYLIQRELVKNENIDVSSDEIESKIKEISERYPEIERNDFVQFYRRDENRLGLKNDIYDRKLFNHLKQFAKVKKEIVKTSELRKRNII
ncbi:MAG: trigger factor [Candidatus Marinimicrobia bacterium]|nr:trigger factor [Candidatus Neomarinimicrobiota bacterium]